MSRAKRQNLEGVETVWFSLRMPRPLHEELRAKAFQERKSISLAITELLERGLAEGVGHAVEGVVEQTHRTEHAKEERKD